MLEPFAEAFPIKSADRPPRLQPRLAPSTCLYYRCFCYPRPYWPSVPSPTHHSHPTHPFQTTNYPLPRPSWGTNVPPALIVCSLRLHVDSTGIAMNTTGNAGVRQGGEVLTVWYRNATRLRMAIRGDCGRMGRHVSARRAGRASIVMVSR